MNERHTETGTDRITRAHTQSKALLAMLGVYFDNLERGETDILPTQTLNSFVWQLEQNLENIEIGLDEITRADTPTAAVSIQKTAREDAK